MKFVLFLIKTLSLILCAGLLGAYLYYTFFIKDKNEFIANASLLLFVLSAVITSLAVMLTENKGKSSNGTAGLDAYLADLRKEEKNTAKHIQKALPENLVPMLEKVVAAMSDNKDGIERIVLDSKTAFSSALSENKSAISGILGDNRNAVNDTISENIRLLEARMADSQNTLIEKLENLLGQTATLSAKTLPPLNLALENINTRLDELESKIVAGRVNYAEKTETVPQQSYAPVSEPVEEIKETDLGNETDLSAYDFSNLSDEPVAEPAVENFNDFTNLSDEPVAEPAVENFNDFTNLSDEPVAEPAVENFNDFTNLSDEPIAEPAVENFNDFTNLSDEPSAEPAVENFNDFTNLSDEPSVNLDATLDSSTEDFSDFTNLSNEPVIEPATEDFNDFTNLSSEPMVDINVDNSESADKETQVADSLSDLADLEIMKEPVAPTAEPSFDEIDIDEFLKGRSDVKN